MLRIFTIVLLLFSLNAGSAHDYYLSVARLEFDEKASAFELSVWFFADDIGLALSQMSGQEIDWKEDRKALADSLLEHFLNETLYLTNEEGDKITFDFVGSKEDGELIYAFLQHRAASPEGFSVQFISLCKQFKAQRNLLHYKRKSSRRTLYFDDSAQPQQLEK
jgi:hypothetical protein